MSRAVVPACSRRLALRCLVGAPALALSRATAAERAEGAAGPSGAVAAGRTPALDLYAPQPLVCGPAAGEAVAAEPGAAARLAVWLAGEPLQAVPSGAPPPADCGWLQGEAPASAELVIRASLAWRVSEDAQALLQRLGAVSRWRGITYWSTSEQRRITLVRQAFAVPAPDDPAPRADFSLAELRSGQPLWFRQQDNRSGSAVLFELRGQALAGGGLQVRVRNREAVRWLGLSLAGAGELQWMQRLQPAAGGVRIATVWLAQRHLHLGSRAQHLRSGVSRAMAMLDALSDRQTPLPALP